MVESNTTKSVVVCMLTAASRGPDLCPTWEQHWRWYHLRRRQSTAS